jgi:hypothetical protein
MENSKWWSRDGIVREVAVGDRVASSSWFSASCIIDGHTYTTKILLAELYDTKKEAVDAAQVWLMDELQAAQSRVRICNERLNALSVRTKPLSKLRQSPTITELEGGIS